MARKRFGLRDLLRRGDRTAALDPPAIEQALASDGLRMSVISTTTMLEILHRRMSAQGWGSLPAVRVPMAPEPDEPLPERPTDLGEGLWR